MKRHFSTTLLKTIALCEDRTRASDEEID